MPTYHYRCSDCEHAFDFFQRFSEDPLTVCPECGGPIRRIPQPVGLVFKGSGWYVNDSRKSESSPATPSKSEKPATDTVAAETKTEPAAAKPESKTPVAASAAAKSVSES